MCQSQALAKCLPSAVPAKLCSTLLQALSPPPFAADLTRIQSLVEQMRRLSPVFLLCGAATMPELAPPAVARSKQMRYFPT